MTIGVYKLSFANTDKVYIGKSINIEQRFKGHLRSFKREEASNKMSAAFSTYGAPTLSILYSTDDEDTIDDMENKYIKEYNAVCNGFNTIGESVSKIVRNRGELNHKSKYSNITILECFNLLVDEPDMLFDEIEQITGVPRGSITMLARGVNHKWIEDYYPEKYARLMELIGTRKLTCKTCKVQGIKLPDIKSPEGIIYSIDSIRAFARLHGLDQSALGRVLHNKAKTHKGWKLA